jgi:hypothetical protein
LKYKELILEETNKVRALKKKCKKVKKTMTQEVQAMNEECES